MFLFKTFSNCFLKIIEKCSVTIKLRLFRQFKITHHLKVFMVKYTQENYWKRNVSYFSGCLKESGNFFSSAFTIYSTNLLFGVLNTIFFLKKVSPLLINRFYQIRSMERSRRGLFLNWYTMLCLRKRIILVIFH